jgi:hypothetical protein
MREVLQFSTRTGCSRLHNALPLERQEPGDGLVEYEPNHLLRHASGGVLFNQPTQVPLAAQLQLNAQLAILQPASERRLLHKTRMCVRGRAGYQASKQRMTQGCSHRRKMRISCEGGHETHSRTDAAHWQNRLHLQALVALLSRGYFKHHHFLQGDQRASGHVTCAEDARVVARADALEISVSAREQLSIACGGCLWGWGVATRAGDALQRWSPKG